MSDDPGPSPEHIRPVGVDDRTVEGLGSLSESLEEIENARGLLFGFHRMIGHADLVLGKAVDQLRAAGHVELADQIDTELVGRNVIDGRWSFQLVEEFDDGYYALFKQLESEARELLAQGRRHLFEAEMKEVRRTHGRAGHEAVPSQPTDVPSQRSDERS